jgi:cytochrome c553
MQMIRVMMAAAALAAALAVSDASAQQDPAIRQKAETCFACHGPNGNSENPQYPILAGQSWRYIYIQLRDFKEGRRSDPSMTPMVADLTRDDMIALGNFFAAQKPAPIKF